MTSETTPLGSIFLLGLISLIALLLGRRNHVFDLGKTEEQLSLPIHWIHPTVGFAIYFGVSLLVTSVLARFLQKLILSSHTADPFLTYPSWLNFINSSLIAIFLLLFLRTLIPALRIGIWRDPRQNPPPYLAHIGFASLLWVISFPCILFVNQSLDWILQVLFHIQQPPEQLAVYFLKMTFGHPFHLTLAIITIILLAPLIEEILFRGLLQSYIRCQIGSKQAIFITSTLFALFHFSPSQGASNFTIISSLFVFSLFIGLSYEKKRSLITPIFLHALFNAINVMNLYFLGKTPKITM